MTTKGEAGMSNTMVIALVVLILILVSNVLVYKFAKTPDTKAIAQAVAKERERLENNFNTYISVKVDIIKQKKKELEDLQHQYNRLKVTVEEKAAEASSIKAPVTNKELKERFIGLGYPPK